MWIFAHKVHGSNKGNQFECIPFSTLSLHCSVSTAEGVIILLRKTGSSPTTGWLASLVEFSVLDSSCLLTQAPVMSDFGCV